MGEVNPTPEQLAQADALEKAAADRETRKEESFERCDTDGFLSQWALGICAQRDRLQAQVLRQGGVSEFPALFDLEGRLVATKLLTTKYGLAWGLLASDDPKSRIVGWVNAFPRRLATMERKGYREGHVLAPAKADIRGEKTAYAGIFRTDGGFSRNVEIVDAGVIA